MYKEEGFCLFVLGMGKSKGQRPQTSEIVCKNTWDKPVFTVGARVCHLVKIFKGVRDSEDVKHLFKS
jgi:hypothetical protein